MLFHIIYCLWFAFSLFPGSFKPIYLLKAHLFISWAYDPLFLSLGLNGFSIYLPNSFLSVLLGFFFPLGLPKWPLTLTNTKPKVHKCQIPNANCAQTKESHKAIPKVATYQERANHQTAEPSNNKPLSLFQIATHKYQITKPRESLFSSTHTLYFFHSFLSNCRNTYVLFIHKASRLVVIALHQNCYES